MSAIIPQSSAPVSGLGSFDFHGHDVAVYHNDRGHWVSVTQLCDAMGIDSRSQRRRIVQSPWSEGCRTVMTLQVPGDTQSREHFLLHQRRLPMWLGSIVTSRIKDEAVRARVEEHQTEFADVLADYVYEGGAINPRASVDQLAELRERVVELEKIYPTWQAIMADDGDFSVRDAAAILNRDHSIVTGQNMLFQYMRLCGMLDQRNRPYAKHKEHLVRRMGVEYLDELGQLRIGGSQVRVTTKGMAFLHRRLSRSVPA